MADGFRAAECWAYLLVAPDGDEALPAIIDPTTGGPMPLVGLDRERIESLRPYVERVSAELGTAIKLVRFGQREDVETIGGGRNYG